MPRQIPTPYDGSSKLFQIGVKPLAPADWIDVDERLPAHLQEKERILATEPDVFMALPQTEAAQAEMLALLAEHLLLHHANLYRREPDGLHIAPANRTVRLDASEQPLLTAGKLVQEDLILLRRSDEGWRVVAGFLAFPSSWSLADKLGRPMHEVHSPVPGFGAETRPNELIGRMFDNLRPDTPLIRWNWSLYGDDVLRHTGEAIPGTRRFGTGERADPVFLRVERQTLRRLPMSGDIVFTVRIHVDPLETLERHADGARIAAAIAEQLALTPEQAAYKGMTAERERVLMWLAEFAAR
ncbi:MAG: heme-dependent oxidative N-demethylase family protein [Devosia sp.]